MKTSTESFLKRQMKKILINEAQLSELANIRKGSYNEVKSWSSLKLIFLNWFSDIYSGIMKKNFRKFYYIDLFSGSGIGRVEDSQNKDLIIGSPLIVATQRKDFTKMFFCDSNEKFCQALQERLQHAGVNSDKFQIYNGDCNNAVRNIVSSVKDGHSLIFIDPYGMEITWSTMKSLLALKADIIINFQTLGISRAKNQHGVGPVITRFFKDAKKAEAIYSRKGDIGKELLEMYTNDIKDERSAADKGKTIVEEIRVRKDDTFFYDLIFVSRETSGGSPWIRGIREARSEIETLEARDVKTVIDVLKGRQMTLGSLPKSDLSRFLTEK